MTALTHSVQLSPHHQIPCPVCGHTGGCLLLGDEAVICRRVEAGCATRRDGSLIAAKDGHGWLHRLKDKKPGPKSLKLPGRKKLTTKEVQAILKQHRADLTPERLAKEAKALGLSERSLKEYGAGYDKRTGKLSFPMFDGDGGPCGIRTRWVDESGSRKGCVRGSRTGLFIPQGYNPRPCPLTDDQKPLLLLTPEGPTDCCAAFDLGFVAVGRPNNSSGTEQLSHLISRGCKQQVVVVADNDEPTWLKDKDGKPTEPYFAGIEGALSVLEALLKTGSSLQFLLPPEKDLRQWLAKGCSTTDLLAAAVNAPLVDEKWLAKAKVRLEAKKAELKKNAVRASGPPA